ncbi:MAG: 2,3-bisphosphoglycerate-independent phosphoglycerate mutase [Patescibacteria group bacterium]|nr:2,3-bisphosphoglycerate-independent phosphoglycerate mutase [Patescibacteria group bacterium]
MPKKASKPARPAPVVLAVLDGWGIAPPANSNAVTLAKTPVLDAIRARYPHTQLMAHGRYVGLLPDQEGNSEAGHMNIGAGRIVRQDIVYVSEAIKDRTFFKNMAFKEVFKHAQKYGTKVHLLGLMSNGNSAHSCPDHLYAMLKLCHEEGMDKVRLHLFTDGRDSPPFSATRLLHDLEPKLYPNQAIATIMGRFYAMDRNKRWNRIEMAYNAIVNGEGLVAPSAHAAILHGYNRGESDEYLLPTVITDDEHRPLGAVGDNDVFIYFNLRSDRARELTKCFVQKDFELHNENAFKRKRVPKNTRFAAMTDFGPDLPHVFTAFPSRDIQLGMTEVMAPLRQFYIAESEKYAHVTYFFNGGFADTRAGEERMRIPSPFIAHYDDKPEMRAPTIASEVVRRIKNGQHDFICLNFANLDMVGHTGNLAATVKAMESVDVCLGQIHEAVKEAKGHLVITADHGNAECKVNPQTGEVMTEHTTNPVPFILASEKFRRARLGDGMLADIAPTILDIMELPKPVEMTGFSLLRS